MNLKHNAYESMSKLYCGFTTGSQEELLWLMDITRYIGYLEGKISELKSKDEDRENNIEDTEVNSICDDCIEETENAVSNFIKKDIGLCDECGSSNVDITINPVEPSCNVCRDCYYELMNR